jgi:HPt (histidine-containing phosphotransfer) domain-containing protein
VADLPVLDQERLRLVTRGDAELASDLLRQLIDEAEDVLQRLHRALAGGDRAAVADLAHALKGMAAEVGALRLRAAAVALEAEPQPALWLGLLDRARAALVELRSLASDP